MNATESINRLMTHFNPTVKIDASQSRTVMKSLFRKAVYEQAGPNQLVDLQENIDTDTSTLQSRVHRIKHRVFKPIHTIWHAESAIKRLGKDLDLEDEEHQKYSEYNQYALIFGVATAILTTALFTKPLLEYSWTHLQGPLSSLMPLADKVQDFCLTHYWKNIGGALFTAIVGSTTKSKVLIGCAKAAFYTIQTACHPIGFPAMLLARIVQKAVARNIHDVHAHTLIAEKSPKADINVRALLIAEDRWLEQFS